MPGYIIKPFEKSLENVQADGQTEVKVFSDEFESIDHATEIKAHLMAPPVQIPAQNPAQNTVRAPLRAESIIEIKATTTPVMAVEQIGLFSEL